GWQTVTFANPVQISKSTTYTASYHTNTGDYAVDLNTLTNGLTNGPLHIPANGGVYSYGSGGFPSNAIPHNLWVDVIFTTSKPVTLPTVTSVTPINGAGSQLTTVAPTATFSTSMNSSSIQFTVSSGTTAVAGTMSYSDTNHTATFTPSAPLSNGVTYTAAVTGSDGNGTAMQQPFTWTFTTVPLPNGSTLTIFPDTAVPQTAN